MTRSTHQLALPLPAGNTPPPRRLEAEASTPETEAQTDSALPAHLHLGALDWVRPGWDLWGFRANDQVLEREGLRHYAAQPLFRTVCIGARAGVFPATTELVRYASQLPDDYACVVDLGEDVTAPRFLRSRGADQRAGRANAHFLDPHAALSDILRPAQHALGSRLRLVLLRFRDLAAGGLRPGPFAERLGRFVRELPADLPIAVELRERAFLTLDYARVLAEHGVTHILSSAPGMPRFTEQVMAVPTGAEVVACLDEPLTAASPYATSALRRRNLVDALSLGPVGPRPTYVLADDGAEGDAPTTLRALAQALLPGRSPGV